nr:hypothetical protein [Tanacetum cinerariifolium]
MKRFKNAIFKQRAEINDRMTEMFGLLKELMTSRAPEKVLIREEAKFPVTKNVNSISLTRWEEERSEKIDITTGDDFEKPTKTETKMLVKEAVKEDEAENAPNRKAEKEKNNREEMEQVNIQTSGTTKLPILKQGEYKMWRLRIEQYFQIQDYALWDVIKNGNSFKPVAQTVEDSKSLFDAITTRFGRNDATRKTQKTLLKQMYENFSAQSTESLDSIFNRLQNIVSQLAVLGESISQEDLNLNFLRILPSEWNTHVVVWRNKSDLDKINLEQIHEDDLEEMDLKWQLALLSMTAKRFFQKTDGTFYKRMQSAKEPGEHKQESRNHKRTVNVEDTSSKAMVEINGARFDWSYTADDEATTNMAFMAFLDSELEKISKKKDDIKIKLEKFENASQSLDKLIGSQITNKSKRGLGYISYNDVPPPHTGRFLPPRIDLSHNGLPEFTEPNVESYRVKPIEVVTQTSSVKIFEPVKENNDAPLIEDWESEGEDEEIYPTLLTLRSLMKGMLHLGDELKVMCDKKNNVLFTGTECFVLSPDFKLADESHVLLKVTRKNNMYNVDMKNIVPKKDLTCFVEKNRVLVVKPHFKTPYELFRGTNSNNFTRKRASFNTSQSSMETRPSQDYILMPLWNDGSLFSSSSKDSDGDNKDNDGPCKESEIDNQERPNAGNNTKDVNIVGPSINTASLNINTASLTVNTVRKSDDFFGADNDMRSLDGVEVDISNISTTYPVPTTPNTRIHKDHSLDNVIGDMQFGVQTRRMTVTTYEQGFISAIYEEKTHVDLHTCLFACFLSQEEPKRITNALKDPAWLEAMQEELMQFHLQKVWTLVDLHREGIDYDEVFALVARIKSIRLFLAYASFTGFLVYQMNVKSTFLYGRIEEDVYVCQPLGFEDPDYLDKVYKVEKALYGLHQAPRAWYETLAKYLLDNRFHRGKIDQTLFIERQKEDILLVQVYENSPSFLGLQVKQKSDGIFISQDNYVDEILRKFKYADVKPASTLTDKEKALLKDSDGDDVDVHIY